jgi:hypothetical protein
MLDLVGWMRGKDRRQCDLLMVGGKQLKSESCENAERSGIISGGKDEVWNKMAVLEFFGNMVSQYTLLRF